MPKECSAVVIQKQTHNAYELVDCYAALASDFDGVEHHKNQV